MFFSVKYSVKIAGKVYSPCICYALPEALRPTIEKLVKEGKAYAYDHKVFFQNGKVLEKKESKPVTVEKKKAKKEKTTPVKDAKELAEEAEIIPSPEEIADNLDEGF